ncbi:MAG TPA: hypothetical protein VJP02_04680 [Candidatus Sulfotelmatobacter sp.]|nr:hypothetical protein [Candidatus Sulfotelmatobacter sp.]
MKRVLGGLFTLAAAVALLLGIPLSKHGAFAAHASKVPCTVATLKGNYGFTFNGYQAVTGPHGGTRNVPFVGAGLYTFDGAGNVVGTFALSLNGQITENVPYAATYTVNPDCTGSAVGIGNGDSADFVIVKDGAEFLAVDTSSGESLTVDAKKQ